MRFEWDNVKNEINRKKHGIDFGEAVFMFTDKEVLSLYDEEHSESEERWITIGHHPDGMVMVVCHTHRVEDGTEIIRLISARKATKGEMERYYESKR
jgi:uncharacterized DUF497 family protein